MLVTITDKRTFNVGRHTRTMAMTALAALAVGACSSGNAYVNMAKVQPKTQKTYVQRSGDESLKVLADRMVDAGDFAAAIPLYKHLLRKNTNDPALHTALGLSLLAMGEHNEAQMSLAKAIQKGDMGEANYGMGKIHLAMGNYGDAAEQFSAAASNMPNDPRPYSGQGIALAAMGQFDAAMSAFDAGLLQNPNNTETLSNKALTLALLGSSDVAVDMLEQMSRTGAAGPRDRQNLALAYLMSDRKGDAVSMARVDMDMRLVEDTLMFYESLKSLPLQNRMAALVTGTIDPEQNRQEAANLVVEDNDSKKMAASRLTAPQPVIEPEPVQVEAPVVDLDVLPPMVEPTGWALQIGAYRDIPALMTGMKILYSKNDDIIGTIPPRRSEVKFPDNGTKGPRGFFYRLNAGPLQSRAAAQNLCKELKARGTDCWVRPPEKSEGKLQ